MRDRYRVERDKRLRADGNDQYIEVVGEFAHYTDDPYVESPIDRPPLTDEVDVIVVRYEPVHPERKRGFVLLRDLEPDQPEDILQSAG